MSKRIIGDKVDINYDDTLSFFEKRGSKTGLKHLYNHVLYQDNNPDLAVQRDHYEKSRIVELLKLDKNDKVLDIGCGVGRWGEEILKGGAYYVGFDFSKNLLALACENLAAFDNDKYDLINCSFQEIVAGVHKSKIVAPYNKVILAGILIYLNDEDIICGLNDLLNFVAADCLIYIREPMSIHERLTLNRFYSEELKTEYDAIYRSKSEYKDIFQKTLLSNGFEITIEDHLYPGELDNRKETSQYFLILQRKG